MKHFLLATYRFFKPRRFAFGVFTVACFAVLAFIARNIRIEEDVTKLLPNGKQAEQINNILRNSHFYDRIIVRVSTADKQATPEVLMPVADSLQAALSNKLAEHIASIKCRVEDEATFEVYKTVHNLLPLYLDEADYRTIDTLISAEQIPKTLADNYQTITSAGGMVMKRLIADDPVGITTLALRKLQSLQADDNFEMYDGYILSKDHKSLYLFVTPAQGGSETGKNAAFVDGLDSIVDNIQSSFPGVQVAYYGGIPVAVGNARQLKQDTILTLSITVVAILLVLGLFFKRKRIPVIMMLPVLFGGLFALAAIALIKGSISAIALGAGSIILGIAINYSLHFFSHYKHCGSVEEAIADLVGPMTIGSITTVGSFFSLTLLQSQILNDFGWFAGFSLVGATIFALIFLPHFTPAYKPETDGQNTNALERALTYRFKYQWVLLLIIGGLTVFFFYHARHVGFESDMNQFNYMDSRLKKAAAEIDWMQSDTSKTVFIASTGGSVQQMLLNNEQLLNRLAEAQKKGLVTKYSSISPFMPSEELQAEKLQRWNNYWTAEKKAQLVSRLKTEGAKLKFTPAAFTRFENLLNKEYAAATESDWAAIKELFGNEYLVPTEGGFTAINAVTVDKAGRKELYAGLEGIQGVVILDKQIITNRFIEVIYDDFNSVLLYTSLLVFTALLISYGRLELALITFLPMVITWVWILGIMALAGLKFNIINIIISTFIFGLGDDFSIFISDGLQRKFKEGKEILTSHKVSIFLSAITISIGLGALIFAKHPALRSIALISIIGIFCVLLIGQTVQPFLFNYFIQNRKEKGLAPWTFTTLALAIFAFSYYVVGSLLLTLAGYVLMYLVPFVPRKKKKLLFHYMVCNTLKSLSYIMMNVRKVHINKQQMDFSKPAVIISNHLSFLDILVTVMQHPRLILLTNRWVYYSPVFGKVVQLADYYPVMEGVDPAIDKFEDIVKDGYSIVIFPEGTRSPDGKMKRFHKGAFFLAEKLNLDIVPLVLHGTGDTMRKGDFMLMNGQKTMKFLPRILPADKTFGEGYAERTKSISKYFKREYEKLRAEIETASYFRQRLRMNYLYKGPKVEWLACRVAKLEPMLDALNASLPRHGHITELRCNYGFVSYMLHFMADGRQVTGVSEGAEMVDIANNCYSKNKMINFDFGDENMLPPTGTDVCIVNNLDNALNAENLKQMIRNASPYLSSAGRIVVLCAGDATATLKAIGPLAGVAISVVSKIGQTALSN